MPCTLQYTKYLSLVLYCFSVVFEIMVPFLFRLISEKTVEENILKKANQKRLLGDVAIEGGNFTTATLQQVNVYFEHY